MEFLTVSTAINKIKGAHYIAQNSLVIISRT